MTKDALDAVEILENDGIECAVINVHTIKPIDCEGVKRAALDRCRARSTGL